MAFVRVGCRAVLEAWRVFEGALFAGFSILYSHPLDHPEERCISRFETPLVTGHEIY